MGNRLSIRRSARVQTFDDENTKSVENNEGEQQPRQPNAVAHGLVVNTSDAWSFPAVVEVAWVHTRECVTLENMSEMGRAHERSLQRFRERFECALDSAERRAILEELCGEYCCVPFRSTRDLYVLEDLLVDEELDIVREGAQEGDEQGQGGQESNDQIAESCFSLTQRMNEWRLKPLGILMKMGSENLTLAVWYHPKRGPKVNPLGFRREDGTMCLPHSDSLQELTLDGATVEDVASWARTEFEADEWDLHQANGAFLIGAMASDHVSDFTTPYVKYHFRQLAIAFSKDDVNEIRRYMKAKKKRHRQNIQFGYRRNLYI